jgi:hydroxymethylglutaryl-CoA lyase
VFSKIKKFPGVSYPCLVPNEKGLEDALSAGVDEVAIFASSTETFSKKNLNCSIKESLDKYERVTELALKNHLRVRGYVSMVMGCPYEGEVDPDKVRQVTHRLFEMGCY